MTTNQKSGRFWQVFSFYSYCECFINNKDLMEYRFAILHVLVPFLKIKMFLVTFDFEHTYIKKWCYASGVECNSCEIRNQIILTVLYSFSKRR